MISSFILIYTLKKTNILYFSNLKTKKSDLHLFVPYFSPEKLKTTFGKHSVGYLKINIVLGAISQYLISGLWKDSLCTKQ